MISFKQLATTDSQIRLQVENYRNALLTMVEAATYGTTTQELLLIAEDALNGKSFSRPEPS